MDKDKVSRKKSAEIAPVPPPPPPPPPLLLTTQSSSTSTASSISHHKKLQRRSSPKDDTDPFIRLSTYKERENLFLKSLNDSIKLYEADQKQSVGQVQRPEMFDFNRIILESLQEQSCQNNINNNNSNSGNGSLLQNSEEQSAANNDNNNVILNECTNYLTPLLNRAGPSVTAAISTKGALDQLDKLHYLVKQLLTLQEQNIRMQRCVRNVETMYALKTMQNQTKPDSDAFLNNTIYESDPEFDNEFEQNFEMLETILAAGRSASSKRSNTKRHRSKSVFAEDNQPTEQDKENNSGYVLRRQSATTDFKPKVSKWTKVKAAFKWEKANALQDSKPETGLAPINNEVARYLRVPSATHGASSVDSAMSSSSGHFLSSGSAPPTPGELSSASSTEDLCDMGEDKIPKRDSIKSDSRILEDDAKKVLPVDSESAAGRSVDKAKTKSAWSKVKGIVKTHKGSIKNRSRSVKSSSSVGCSRDASPCESIDNFSNENRERTDSFSSSQTSPSHRNHTPTFTLTLPSSEGGSCPNSPTIFSNEETEAKSNDIKVELRTNKGSVYRGQRKSKHIPGIESLPEGMPLESVSSSSGSSKKPPPSPLNLRQDYSSDGEINEPLSSPGSQENSKTTKFRKTSAPTTVSVPNSPLKHFEFFGDFESDDLSSGDFSEPTTPQRRLSTKSRNLAIQREEIKKKYLELQKKLHREFEAKQMEWERIRPATVALSNSPIHMLLKDDSSPTLKSSPTNPIAEENLPPDFKKKLNEWRIKHQPSSKEPTGAIPKDVDSKKKTTDWQLWKTGQIKLEGQGLKTLPDAKDLPEDFQKKLSEWKQMKATNKVPAFTATSNEHSLKRRGNKLQKCTNFSTSIKKSKIGEDTDKDRHKEGLSKLKALVADPPKKEVVVRTTKGVMKFEGISRKFTRKLYEWEKSKGIGPEASTFALLHPGYRPVVVENAFDEIPAKRERSPGLVRSFSAESILPNQQLPAVSHHPSSLSLNDADSFMEASLTIDPRRVSSNPEIDLSNDNENDEPEAVLVEVQDFEVETAIPLITAVPIIEQQMPVYRYEPAQNIKCADTRNPVILRKSYSSLDRPFYALKNAININETLKYDEVFDKNVERLKNVLKSLIDSLPVLRVSVQKNNPEITLSMDLVKGLSVETIKMLKQLDRYTDNQKCLESSIAPINEKVSSIKQILNSLHITKEMLINSDIIARPKDETIPEISITPAYGAHASEILHMVDHFSCDDFPKVMVESAKFSYPNEVMVNQVQVISHSSMMDSINVGGGVAHKKLTRTPKVRSHDSAYLYSESDYIPNTSQSQDSSYGTEEKNDVVDTDGTYKNQDVESKRLTRNASNGSRRKTRIRRMGSRQNSKTDSDSDDDAQTFVLDAPRKTKRKTSKAKKPVECEKRCDTPPLEDVVYVLKVRASQNAADASTVAGSCLISPTETCVELLDGSQENASLNSVPSNVLIQTKRKIFAPVKNSTAVIVHEIESPTKDDELADDCTKVDEKVVESLPPQSPSFQRKLEQMKQNAKDMSPNIRMMIAKYNHKLSTDKTGTSPQSSGSCSPIAWRSPVLDRRVRKQTEMYQEKCGQIQKSSSAGSIRKTPEPPKETSVTPTAVRKCSPGVVKSTSDGAIQMDWKIVDLTKNIYTMEKLQEHQTHTLTRSKRKEFITVDPKDSASSNEDDYEGKHKYVEPQKVSSAVQNTGAIRKIRLQENKTNWKGSPHFSRSNDTDADSLTNTAPKITRKYETKPPSPRLYKKNSNKSQPIYNTSICSSSSNNDIETPTTPLSQRARKIRQARADFLNMPSVSQDQSYSSNRISQFSTASCSSTDDSVLMKSVSATYIETAVSTPPNYGSLPRNMSGAVALPDIPRGNSRFCLSSLASKLKKVKLRKSSKDLTKMNAVSALCRQSLVVDIGKTSQNQSDSNLSNDKRSTSEEPLKKSSSQQSSTGILSRFRKNDKESVAKLKKSRSLGLLEQEQKNNEK